MIEIKDEILEAEPRYRLRDENGNIILDNLTLEMITKIIQEPTPLNKILLDEPKCAYPTARYWEPSLVFGAEASYFENIMPTLESNNSDENFIVTANLYTQTLAGTTYGLTNDKAYLLFDKNYENRVSLDNNEYAEFNTINRYIKIEFSKPVKLKTMRLYGYQHQRSNGACYLRVLGSNDNTNWTSLGAAKVYYSDSDTPRASTAYINSAQYYKYLKFDKEDADGYDPLITRLNLDVYQVDTEGNENYLDLDFGKGMHEYVKGQKLSILVPSNLDTGLTSKLQYDNLGYKDVVTLTPGAFTNLIYDGTSFIKDIN